MGTFQMRGMGEVDSVETKKIQMPKRGWHTKAGVSMKLCGAYEK